MVYKENNGFIALLAMLAILNLVRTTFPGNREKRREKSWT